MCETILEYSQRLLASLCSKKLLDARSILKLYTLYSGISFNLHPRRKYVLNCTRPVFCVKFEAHLLIWNIYLVKIIKIFDISNNFNVVQLYI